MALKSTSDHLWLHMCFSLVRNSWHAWNLETECQILHIKIVEVVSDIFFNRSSLVSGW